VSVSWCDAAKKIADLEAERDGMQKEIDRLKAESEGASEAMASAAVEAAVTAGRIAPQDDKSKAFWKASIKADPASVSILEAIPGKDVTKTVFAGRVEANPNDDGKETGLDRAIKAHKASKTNK